MDVWWQFYEKLFNFREIRYFDIEGKLTGLRSRALTSPCGQIRIPINESADDKSQIEEYLRDYKGEGIQHVACGCHDVYETVEVLASRGVPFMPSPPDTYYAKVDARLANADFVAKAPPEVIEENRERKAAFEATVKKLKMALKRVEAPLP